MSNEKKKKGITDYFDALASTLEKNSKIIVQAFIALVLVVGLFFCVSMYRSYSLNSTAKTSGKITRRIELLEKAYTQVKDKKTEEIENKFKQEIQSLHQDAQKFLKDHPKNSLGDLLFVRWTDFLMKHKQEDLALEISQGHKVSQSSQLSATALFSKAKVLLAKDKKEEAIESYTQVLNNKKWEIFKAEAYIKRALVQESLGKMTEAKQDLEAAASLDEKSEQSKVARKYLRMLLFKEFKNNG